MQLFMTLREVRSFVSLCWQLVTVMHDNCDRMVVFERQGTML